MACAFSLSPHKFFSTTTRSIFFTSGTRRPIFTPILSSVTKGRAPYNNALISEAVRLLGPQAKFEASKLTVDFMGQDVDEYSRVVPRIYILSHCDFTGNLTLTISNIINVDQLQGWYSKDDVVAEWKDIKGKMHLVIHCYVSGPNNLLRDLVAELRYHIFSKELPLVLQAVQYGDSALFRAHPDLVEAVVWVYFHSSSTQYNCIECWGPLKDAAQRRDQVRGLLTANETGTLQRQKLQSPKSFLQALFTFLLWVVFVQQITLHLLAWNTILLTHNMNSSSSVTYKCREGLGLILCFCCWENKMGFRGIWCFSFPGIWQTQISWYSLNRLFIDSFYWSMANCFCLYYNCVYYIINILCCAI